MRAWNVTTFMALWLLAGCASMDRSIEVKNDNAADLPAIADLADPGAARIEAQMTAILEEGREMVIHFQITSVVAKGSVAPPLSPGRRIEVAIPRVQWLAYEEKRKQNDKPMNMTIKYQGKPRFAEATSAWRWVQFH